MPGVSKQFESQKGTDRLRGGNHLCSREPRFFQQLLQGDLSQIREKQVQPPELGPDLPWGKVQPVHIGNLRDLGPRPWDPFFVLSPRQPGKALFFEDQRDRDGTYPMPAFFQDSADIIDGEVLFSQRDDFIPDMVGFGRSLRALLRGKEEGAIWMLAEMVRKDAEASGRIPEAAGDFSRGQLVNEVGSEGFVLTVSWVGGFEKEACHIC